MSEEDKQEPAIPVMALPDVLEEGDLPGSYRPPGGIMAVLSKHLKDVPRGAALASFNEHEVRAVVRAMIELLGGESVGGRWKVQLGVPGVELKALEGGSPVEQIAREAAEKQGKAFKETAQALEKGIQDLLLRVEKLEGAAKGLPEESLDFLNSRIEELEQQLEALSADDDDGDEDKDAKPKKKAGRKKKRGRPKKQKQEEPNPLDAPMEG